MVPFSRSRFVTLVASFLLGIGSLAAEDRKPLVDPHGDQLPQGALLRIGTGRFRHSDSIHSVAFMADNKTVVSASHDATVRLWEASTGKELRRYKGSASWIGAFALSADGNTIAIATGEGHVLLWDVDSGKERRVLAANQGMVGQLAFSPDGKTLLTGTDDSTLRLWDLATDKELWQSPSGAKWIRCVAFSPDGKFIAMGGGDAELGLFSPTTGKPIRQLTGHKRPIEAISFSGDSKTLASSSQDGTTRLWDVAAGKEVRTFETPPYECHGVALSADGKIVATNSGHNIMNASTTLWDAATGKEIRRMPSSVGKVAFSRDGKWLAQAASWDYRLQVWDVATGKQQGPDSPFHRGVWALAWSPDGKHLVVGGDDNPLLLWDPATGRQIREILAGGFLPRSVTYSPDGSLLAVVTGGHSPVFETATWKERMLINLQFQSGGRAAFSPDGQWLAIGSGTGRIELWDVKANKSVSGVSEGSPGVVAIQFTPDGKGLAAAFQGRELRFWKVANMEEEKRFEKTNYPYATAFSPDGKQIACLEQNGTLMVLNAANGEERYRVGEGFGIHMALAFSPDSRMLAIGDKNGVVRVVETGKGRELFRFEGHTGMVGAVVFAPDGRRLASSGRDTTILIWDLPPPRK